MSRGHRQEDISDGRDKSVMERLADWLARDYGDFLDEPESWANGQMGVHVHLRGPYVFVLDQDTAESLLEQARVEIGGAPR